MALSIQNVDAPEGGQVLGVRHRRLQASVERDVDVCAECLAGAALVGRARAREEVALVVAVQRHVEDARVVVGHLLGAVAMVHVPVH